MEKADTSGLGRGRLHESDCLIAICNWVVALHRWLYECGDSELIVTQLFI